MNTKTLSVTLISGLALVACRAPRQQVAVPSEAVPSEATLSEGIPTSKAEPVATEQVPADPPQPLAEPEELPMVGPVALNESELHQQQLEVTKHAEELAGKRQQRIERRAQLQREVALNPGWGLYESEHYFILSQLHDPVLIEELKLRADAERSLLAQEFPGTDGSTLPTLAVIRVFGSELGYHEYGGAQGSTAFYAALLKEAVIYFDVHDTQSHDRWSGLQHILVHEYLSDSLQLGETPPWMLYGIAELYAGMQLSGTELVMPEQDERLRGRALNTMQRIPLADLMGFNMREFRGANRQGASAYTCVLHAWSLAYFLRVGSEQSPYWSAEWSRLLSHGVEAAQNATGDQQRSAAIEASYAKLDLAALEAAWMAWLKTYRDSWVRDQAAGR